MGKTGLISYSSDLFGLWKDPCRCKIIRWMEWFDTHDPLFTPFISVRQSGDNVRRWLGFSTYVVQLSSLSSGSLPNSDQTVFVLLSSIRNATREGVEPRKPFIIFNPYVNRRHNLCFSDSRRTRIYQGNLLFGKSRSKVLQKYQIARCLPQELEVAGVADSGPVTRTRTKVKSYRAQLRFCRVPSVIVQSRISVPVR